MRAVWYSELGEAAKVLRTGEMERPAPGAGEVLVRIHVSGVNPVDVKRRLGGRGTISAPRVVPHFDGAGVVEAVGAGVDPARVGERVWVYEAQWQRAAGTAAEFVALPERLAVPLPDGTTFAEGAALGIPALTAHRCVFGDDEVSGETVLVTGGAGAVGHYAVQFAKLGGARVLATVSSEEKAALARDAGADHVVNYRQEDVATRIRELTDGRGVDRIVEVELGGNLPTSIEVLKPRGVIAAYASAAEPEPAVPFYAWLYKNAVLRCELVFGMTEEAKANAVDAIRRWLGDGALKHHIGARFPLEEAVAAHQAVEAGAFGKVVLEIV